MTQNRRFIVKIIATLCLVLSLVTVFSGSAKADWGMNPCISEFGDSMEESQMEKGKKKPKNWKQFKEPIEVVISFRDKPDCTPGKVYQIREYLPKIFSMYRLIIFENDAGRKSIFLVENLPRKEDQKNIMDALAIIDP
ncbi:MAG: hypothetical protein HGA61_03220 [Candidatus Moranbacteria bacterium]|nr:hypothetical protein [Candidatus Moranbacteria bacterium]